MEFLKNCIRLLRPVQWIKNWLVLSGILFGGEFLNAHLWLNVVLATAAFCCVSSSIYVFNDIFDRDNDRIHPKKKFRPIASGAVTEGQGKLLSFIIGTLGLLIGTFVSPALCAILFCYILLNILYSVRLKHVVILDVFCISAGFMLRILAGTTGVGIPPSRWIVLCGIMVTLFVGFGKRRAELRSKQFSQHDHRQVLTEYTAPFLDQLITVCAAGTILSYSLYTMSPDTIAIHHTENLIATVPFVIYGLFRYLYLVHKQELGGDPTQDLIRDKHIGITFLAWLTITTAIIHS